MNFTQVYVSNERWTNSRWKPTVMPRAVRTYIPSSRPRSVQWKPHPHEKPAAGRDGLGNRDRNRNCTVAREAPEAHQTEGMDNPMGKVQFRCRLSESTGRLPHFWEHTVGSCHAAMALRADWQAQLRRCHQELGFRHVRFHAILSDDMGTLMDEQDQLLYSFFNADQIWDYLLSIGMKPFVELSFMPSTLSSGGTTVFHYRANVTPPKDFNKWATLIHELVSHWVDRYGVEEVR